VIVGTDRTAANGDVANKIGTYGLAVLAHRHGIPFYVAAPISSVDLACASGDKIPIEERSAREVTHVFDRQIAPSGIRVVNPAFDVTPAELVTAIVTERGVARPPLARTLPRSSPAASGRGKRANGPSAEAAAALTRAAHASPSRCSPTAQRHARGS
jgi:methylthioribose-1-phosphate isomerase